VAHRLLFHFSTNWWIGHYWRLMNFSPPTRQTGAFQVSVDSMDLDKGLKDFVQATLGATDDATFIAGSKSNHTFAIEYAARLLRVTVGANGPIAGHRIYHELNRAAVTEFRGHLETIGDFPMPPRGVRYA
jgi:hypothetical protein